MIRGGTTGGCCWSSLGVVNTWLGVFRTDAPLPIAEVSEDVMGLVLLLFGTLGVWLIGLVLVVGLGAGSG